MMARWGMVVDLRKCIGCGTCALVCDHINKVPPDVQWRRVVECSKEGTLPCHHMFLTISCMHCGKPPCADVCPTTATKRRPDGAVYLNHELCVGCGACVVACPYNARSLSSEDQVHFDVRAGSVTHTDRIGTCTKCNLCLPDLDAGLSRGAKLGVDPEATPACVRFCIAEALHFGDLDDADSEVSRLIRENRTVRLNEELGTDSSVYFIIDEIASQECRESE